MKHYLWNPTHFRWPYPRGSIQTRTGRSEGRALSRATQIPLHGTSSGKSPRPCRGFATIGGSVRHLEAEKPVLLRHHLESHCEDRHRDFPVGRSARLRGRGQPLPARHQRESEDVEDVRNMEQAEGESRRCCSGFGAICRMNDTDDYLLITCWFCADYAPIC